MKVLLTVILLFFLKFLAAQNPAKIPQNVVQDTSTRSVGIKGIVKDSTYRFVLSSATVAVYNNSNSTLLKFSIPNKFGEFIVEKLPYKTPLKLVVTHIGYSPYQKILDINPDKSLINLDTIFMHQNSQKENMLEEVTITALAPVRMNGDTIEFNPRAFKMDPNATSEDLMRILPGMVVWGDGDITYNGKKINSLLVDGKPFMGSSDITVATQNLPKDVLDKVQVYSQRNEKNPLDSTLHANLKLRDDKKMGYFGKIGGGYGNNDRFASDGMLNGFNKKLQITTVGAINNVNKSANSINTLIKSNSYKDNGGGVDYQSDFRRAGINQATTAGSIFQYDFIADPNFRKSRRLTADYYFNRNKETINSNRISNTTLGLDSILNNTNESEKKVISTSNNLSARYLQEERDFSLSISVNGSLSESNNTNKRQGEARRTGTEGSLSANNSVDMDNNSSKGVIFNTVFTRRKERLLYEASDKRKINPFDNFIIGYKFSFEENKGYSHNYSTVTSTANPAMDKLFDRTYQRYNRKASHAVDISYLDFKKLLFGFAPLGGINVDLLTTVNVHNAKINSLVEDNDPSTSRPEVNQYLTNDRFENIQDIQPQLRISKMFYKGLTNRYMERLDINITPVMQYYRMESSAIQDAQNFSYQYSRFVPRASLDYNNHQYGSYELSSKLSYLTKVYYPTVQDRAPLVDSTNVWYIPQGNPTLHPEYVNTFQWKISLESRKPKNPYQINVVMDYNTMKDKISDSTFYDEIGRRINYKINVDGHSYWHVGSSFRKSFSPNKNHTFRFFVSYDRYLYTIPQYLNAQQVTSKNQNDNIDLEIAYSYLDKVNLAAKQGIGLYENRQTGIEQYNGANNYTQFRGTFQFPKNVTWSTNINFNTNKAYNQPTVNYAIWNASVSYRFLKGNQGEVKFSALDLLNENKSIINNTNRNVQTFGFDNVLRQYFMLSVAYYPRKFGK